MSRIKILLAEDDEDDREMFSGFLATRNDIELFSYAENGLEVMESLTAVKEPLNLPDLILLDQNMPKQNGLQTLKKLKETREYAYIPVFIYSTYADRSLQEQSVLTGAISVFSKPFTMQGYNDMLESMLSILPKTPFHKGSE